MPSGRRTQALIILTFTPFLHSTVILKSSVQGSVSLLSILEYSWKSLTRMNAHSVKTICCAGQIRGPPPKGRYSHIGRAVSQRSGRNSWASSPQISGSVCIAWVCSRMPVPFRTKKGDLPSGPPPTGKTVSTWQTRWSRPWRV